MELIHVQDMKHPFIKVVHPGGIEAYLTVEHYRELYLEGSSSQDSAKRRGSTKTRSGQTPVLLTGDPWDNFVSFISGPEEKCVRQRKVLALIKGRKEEGITIDELAEAVSYGKESDPDSHDPNKASGTITGIVRNAKKANLNRNDVVFKPQEGGRLWMAGPLLLEKEIPLP